MTSTASGRKVTNSPIPQQTVQKRDQKGAKPGSAKVKDADGNGYIDSNDKVIIGSKNPSFLMSMSNTLTYKNFYLSFLLNGTFKSYVEVERSQYRKLELQLIQLSA